MNENGTNELVPMEITVETLKAKIYMIRGQRVMFAADLAEIYGYTTKAFNQQVKNNIEKFEEDFRFQLTWDEVEELSRSKNLTLNKEGRGGNIMILGKKSLEKELMNTLRIQYIKVTASIPEMRFHYIEVLSYI